MSEPREGTLPAGTPSARVHEHAAAEGWTLAADVPRTVGGPRYWSWQVGEGDGDGYVTLIEDHRTGLRLVEAEPEAFAERLAGELGLETLEALLERARTASAALDRMRAVQALAFRQFGLARKAAVGAPEDPDHPGCALLADDVRLLEVFERALDDPARGVRRAGVDGLVNSLWTGSLEILRRRRDDLPEFEEFIDGRLNGEFPRLEKKPA